MPDKYDALRSTPFPALAAALGLDLTRFKTRKGGEHYGPCPVHEPKSNSTSFSYAADGKFNCFSCGAKGRGAIDLFKVVKNVGFQAAVEGLGAAAIQEPPNKKSPATVTVGTDNGAQQGTNQALSIKPFTGQYHKFAVPSKWLEKRVPDETIRSRYGVFCYDNPARKSAYSGRVMIPVKCPQGVLYGYLGRQTSQTPFEPEQKTPPSQTASGANPKYLFPRDLPKSHFLFGAFELHQHLAALGTGRSLFQHVYLVESPFCAMKFAAMGLPAVSPFGWSVSEEQVERLRSLTKGVVFLPDRNKYEEAGSHLHILGKYLWLRFPPLPAGIDDPEQMTREQILAL